MVRRGAKKKKVQPVQQDGVKVASKVLEARGPKNTTKYNVGEGWDEFSTGEALGDAQSAKTYSFTEEEFKAEREEKADIVFSDEEEDIVEQVDPIIAARKIRYASMMKDFTSNKLGLSAEEQDDHQMVTGESTLVGTKADVVEAEEPLDNPDDDIDADLSDYIMGEDEYLDEEVEDDAEEIEEEEEQEEELDVIDESLGKEEEEEEEKGEADIDVMDEEQAPSMAAFADGVFNGTTPGSHSQVESTNTFPNLEFVGRIKTQWNLINGKKDLSEKQSEALSLMSTFKDVVMTDVVSAPHDDEIRDVTAAHIVNHVLRHRTKVEKNTTKKRIHEAKERLNVVDGEKEEEGSYQDQGFTRPVAVVICPYRERAYEFVKTVVALCKRGEKGTVANFDRFESQYHVESSKDSHFLKKPESWYHDFDGNTDDTFRVGIQLSRKRVGLFVPFYAADLIVASPLGLRMLIGNDDDKKRDFDFLSSIEMMFIDRADVISMQSWDHLEHVVRHTNLQPNAMRDTDFSRLKNWVTEGWAGQVRQTIVTSQYPFTDLNVLARTHLKNFRGLLRAMPTSYNAVINVPVIRPQQHFHRFKVKYPKNIADKRLAIFKDQVIPTLRAGKSVDGTLIVTPTYYDYLQLRKLLREAEINHGLLSEYMERDEISRVRTFFQKGQYRHILMSERFYFYQRTRIRGVKRVIFYGLPAHSEYYAELASLLGHKSLQTHAYFCQYDVPELERIVGTKNLTSCLKADQTLTVF